LGRWAALIRYINDGDLPIENNRIETVTSDASSPAP
jgi:hypothetical protein